MLVGKPGHDALDLRLLCRRGHPHISVMARPDFTDEDYSELAQPDERYPSGAADDPLAAQRTGR